jgi:peptide/nickel transport system substrate-binding protein
MRLLVLLAFVAACLAGCDEGPSTPAVEWNPQAGDVSPGERRGALLDQVIFTQERDHGRIPDLIQRGSHQLYAEGITNTTVFRRIRDTEGVDYRVAYGSSAELTLNPAGPRFADGRINPFHVREIREALNWLVDRRHVAEELYGGLAVPRVLAINTTLPDYARLAEQARILELRYAYDPERATRVIEEQMSRLGAVRVRGLWTHEGAPVRIGILIRTDDERRRVGDYFAGLFEGLGFQVERMYRSADEASRIWIAGDPMAGRWNIYTAGWVSILVNRDQAANISYYYTPRGRSEPLWQVYEPGPELDDVAERLVRRDYATWDERQALMARALELALENSVRVWLTDQINVLARADNVALASDLSGGVTASALWALTLRYRDRVGGSAVIGTPNLLTSPWNPIAGSNWVFDRMITRGLHDSAVYADPFTGLFWPQHVVSAEVLVQQDVPVIKTLDWVSVERAEEILVPADAWLDWDSGGGRWITAAEKHPDGLTARTRVRVNFVADYLERRWHDGSRVSLADLVLPWILTFERGDPASPLYDVADAAAIDVFKRHFRGRRIVSTEPLVVDYYSDQIFPDAEWIVRFRVAPGDDGRALMPWHVVTPGLLAEAQGELAFSSNKADRAGVDWLSLVAGPSLPILARNLQRAREQAVLPFAGVLGGLVREGEVAERYRALTDWYAARGHFWVDNGAYYLHSVHSVERNVVLRRFDGFADRADKWLRFDEPRIPALDLDGPMVVAVDQTPRFELSISFAGEPYPREDVERVRYLLFDARGDLVEQGDAQPVDDGLWQIVFEPDQLAAIGVGANSLEVAVTSSRVAMPAFVSYVFATTPAGAEPAQQVTHLEL